MVVAHQIHMVRAPAPSLRQSAKPRVWKQTAVGAVAPLAGKCLPSEKEGGAIYRLAVVTTISCAVVVVCLWWRRSTWHSQWERGITANVVCMGVCMVLISPHLNQIWDPLFYRIFGVWNLSDFFGQFAYLIGLCFLLANIVSRFDFDAARYLAVMVELPAAVLVPLLVGVFWCARPDHPVVDFVDYHDNAGWATRFWLLFCLCAGWLLAQLVWALRVLRTDLRSRPTANFYLVAVTVDIVCVISLVFSTLTGIGSFVAWLLMAMAVTLYASAAIFSWMRTIAWFNKARRALEGLRDSSQL